MTIFLVIQLSISMSHGWSESQEFDIQVARHQQNLAQPYFVNFRCFLNKMETQGVLTVFFCLFLFLFLFFVLFCFVLFWFVFEGVKNSLGMLIFCGGCADLMLFTTYLFQKIKKMSRPERFGTFLFCYTYRQSRTTEGQMLAKWRC